MKNIITAFFLVVSITTFAQSPDAKALDKAIKNFDKALLTRDSVALKNLLNEKLVYGHSNLWMETKKELIADLYNGKIKYKKIAPENAKINIEGTTAAVRNVSFIDAEMEGKVLSFKLTVLQVWVWTGNRWELFARQSVKM